MNSLIVVVAEYLLFVILLTAVVVWVYLPRPDKVGLAVRALMSLAVVALLIKVTAALHTDPRPFVVDPSTKPLFAHSADNGFPSDHTALAATAAFLVMTYRRWLGGVLLVASIVLGAARMAAHVHHAQDIAAAVLVAAVAVGISSACWQTVRPHLPPRLNGPVSR